MKTVIVPLSALKGQWASPTDELLKARSMTECCTSCRSFKVLSETGTGRCTNLYMLAVHSGRRALTFQAKVSSEKYWCQKHEWPAK